MSYRWVSGDRPAIPRSVLEPCRVYRPPFNLLKLPVSIFKLVVGWRWPRRMLRLCCPRFVAEAQEQEHKLHAPVFSAVASVEESRSARGIMRLPYARLADDLGGEEVTTEQNKEPTHSTKGDIGRLEELLVERLEKISTRVRSIEGQMSAQAAAAKERETEEAAAAAAVLAIEMEAEAATEAQEEEGDGGSGGDGIAATALAHDGQLATRNTADFDALGLLLINPWARAGTS